MNFFYYILLVNMSMTLLTILSKVLAQNTFKILHLLPFFPFLSFDDKITHHSQFG